MPDCAFWLSQYPEGTPATIEMDASTTLVSMLEDAMRRYRDRPAFALAGVYLSYAKLDQLSQQFANYLSGELKLAPGERVAIMLPNILSYPVALFGILRAGLVAVNVNPLYTTRELQHQLKDCGAAAIVVSETSAATLEQALPGTAVRHIVLSQVGELLGFAKRTIAHWLAQKHVARYNLPQSVPWPRALALGRQHPARAAKLTADSLALLQYTGGTTGVAKGAMLTQGNLAVNVLQCYAWLQKRLESEHEVIMTALPLYHIFSLLCNGLLFSYIGGLNYLIPDPRDMPGFIKTLRKVKFSAISGVNTLYNGLLNTPGFSELDFSNLRLALAGGAALQKNVAERWRTTTGISIIEAYGLTETSPAACAGRMDQDHVYTGSIGLPLSSTEVAIWAENGSNQPLPIGETGELMIRGPQVMAGYWQRPEETAATLTADGWLHTGDIARMDEQGYVYIVDRKKDMILVSGFNVYPNEIEAVVMEHPGVAEVAAIGVPDPQSGETVKIFVVAKDPALNAESLLAFCRQNLTGYKRPHHIELVNSLPKSLVGKILRKELREAEDAARKKQTQLQEEQIPV